MNLQLESQLNLEDQDIGYVNNIKGAKLNVKDMFIILYQYGKVENK